MELSNSIKQRFVKDFKLPINLIQDPYFEYFIELYDEEFKTKEKLQILEKYVATLSNHEEFFSKSKDISEAIKSAIQNTQAYTDFNNADLTKYPSIKDIAQQNIYIVPNIGKDLISIDLEKANYNSFRLFGLDKELNAPTYNDLLAKFTDQEYFFQSKMIRQVIFGDLNPSRQQKIQRYIIGQLCEKLIKAGCVISSASSDEIIVKNKTDVKEIAEILKDVDEKFKFFRIEKFQFNRIGDEFDFFIKETEMKDGSIKKEFKNTPGDIFPQIYKQYKNIELNQYDMLFYHNGYLAEFKDPVFKPIHENNNKKKVKI